jgi:hypothetical protein
MDLRAQIRAFVDLWQRLPTVPQTHLADSGSDEFSGELAALISLRDRR